jgi:ERF superfamily
MSGNTTELLPAERPSAPIAVSAPEDLIRHALDRGADVATMERLLAMRRELKAEHAKEAFDSALADFQAECPIILKKKAVVEKSGGVRYHYAPLDAIVAQTKELLQKHGFSFSLNAEVEPGWVKAMCKVTHRGGHSQVSDFKVPIDPKSFMTEMQKFASALTFAKRYAFTNAFGILTGDEDIDGREAQPKPAGPSRLDPADQARRALALELWQLLEPVRGDKHDWAKANVWMFDHLVLPSPELSSPDLTTDQFKHAIKRAREELAKGAP